MGEGETHDAVKTRKEVGGAGMADTSITQLIKKIAAEGIPGIVVGVVSSVDPVEIIQKDDIGVQLHDQSLIIPSSKLPLEVGEELYLLSVSNNKVYYILDRV